MVKCLQHKDYRLLNKIPEQHYQPAECGMKQKLSEISVDGGSVRLRGEKGEQSYWQQYKIARLQGIYYGAFFQDNISLTDWINSQKLTLPFYCLGDGHDGIWNIFEEIGNPENRQEILEWYHLKENLYKLGGTRKRVKELEELLWQGKVEDSLELLRNKKIKRAKQFCEYLEKHRHRIINYQYFQAEQICSIGSGAVESGVKQIDQRLQKTGAQWKRENVNSMLQLRCAYLNGLLAVKLA